MRHTITVANALAAAAMLANSVCADVLELEVPAAALHGSLRAFGPFSLLTCLLLGESSLLVFHLGEALQALRARYVFYIPAFQLDKLWVGDTLVGRKKSRRESLGGVFTSEVPGLGCGVE